MAGFVCTGADGEGEASFSFTGFGKDDELSFPSLFILMAGFICEGADGEGEPTNYPQYQQKVRQYPSSIVV